jgi:acyl dehydratase
MLTINSYEDFASHLGEELGTSEWLTIDQDRINKFADATLDHQWIHVDVERAKVESPYHSTIAHGYLTMSLIAHLWNQIIEVNNVEMQVNYGMEKMRFGMPVITGSRVRLVTKLHDIADLRGICKAEIEIKMEIEGERKPALQGIASFLYYFKK